MYFSSSALVLGTLAAGQAFAATMLHNHGAKHNHAERFAKMMEIEAEKRDSALLSATDSSKLTSLGLLAGGINAVAASGHAWIGADGQYTNEYVNESGQDLVLVVWGPAGSWVNAVQPQVTLSIPAGQSKTVSFPTGVSGAWSAVYSDTQLVNGQISNTWGEFTFGQYGVVDVSREVNMGGHNMTIVGPSCVTDMDTCVFVCGSGESVCTFGYELLNCENGSQAGANYGTYEGSPSGGCGGMGDSAALKTYLS